MALFDIQISAPKDVNVLAMVGGDERVREGFVKSVLAVVNGGDALELACDADVFPPVPAGHRRTFFLDATGRDKEENTTRCSAPPLNPCPASRRSRLPRTTT